MNCKVKLRARSLWMTVGAGNEFLDGRGGDDWLKGGDGTDMLLTGDGEDSSWGDGGKDEGITGDYQRDDGTHVGDGSYRQTVANDSVFALKEAA